jgi:hypothetical protein
MFQTGYEYKVKEAKGKLQAKEILQTDLWRFVVLCLTLILTGALFFWQFGLVKNDGYMLISRELDEKEVGQMDSGAIVHQLSEEDVLRGVNDIWERMGGNNNLALGENDAAKDGWYGDYKQSPAGMVAFLPRKFSEPVVLSKSGSSLLLEPMGIDGANIFPIIENNHLIYDEIYPGVMVVRMFKDGGLKEYYILKTEQAAHHWFAGLNFQGGQIQAQPSGRVEFVDSQGEKQFELGKLVGFDALGRSIDSLIEQKVIEGNILEVNVRAAEGLKYPLIVDPEVN